MAWWEEIGLGIKVERAADALAIDASPGEPFFTVTGLIRLTGLLGYCTVAVGAGNICQFTLEPTAAGGAITVLDANLDITASTEGDIISIGGDPGTNLLAGHVCVQQMLPAAPRGIILEAGVIGFIATSVNGTFRWVLYYKPIDDGAAVTVIGP